MRKDANERDADTVTTIYDIDDVLFQIAWRVFVSHFEVN